MRQIFEALINPALVRFSGYCGAHGVQIKNTSQFCVLRFMNNPKMILAECSGSGYGYARLHPFCPATPRPQPNEPKRFRRKLRGGKADACFNFASSSLSVWYLSLPI
jgi:hypothetical protein